jgi:hypothetical protein
VATAPAHAYLPLVAAVAMDNERLASVSVITTRFKRLPPEYAARAGLVGGVIETGYQITGWTRLSPTSLIFKTATPGHEILISEGHVKVQIVRDGNITWSDSVCVDNAQCAPPQPTTWWTLRPAPPPPLRAPCSTREARAGARRCVSTLPRRPIA